MQEERGVDLVAVIAGRHYRVTVVDRHAPRSLDEFAVAGEIPIEAVDDAGGRLSLVATARRVEGGARLNEKDHPGGKDVRSWHVHQVGSSFFMEIAAAF